MRIKVNIDLKVNKLVKNFILLDLFLFFGWGLIQPVFAIFVIRNVGGATLITVGLSAAIYWVLKSVLQIPIAKYLDSHPGEKDDFNSLLLSLVMAGFSALAFMVVGNIWQLYLVQAIQAVAFSFYTPAWYTIFAKHLDKDKISFDWSLDSTTVGLAGGISGLFGSVIAKWLGFPVLFLLVGLMSFLSIIFLIAVPDLILPKKTSNESEIIMKDHVGK